MSNVKYSTHSAKPSMLATGTQYGVNEMVETGTSMGLQQGRKIIVEGVTSDIENPFVQDMITDGLSAGIGFFSGQLMQKQEKLLDTAFLAGSAAVVGWYSKSKLLNLMKGKKGKKLSMISKFFGDNDKKAEECRLIADFSKMNMDSSANSHNPLTRQNMLENKIAHDTLQVRKEGVNTSMAKLQIDGMRDTFDMKIKTSSFFNTDKQLIKKMTGMISVTDKEIKKMNSLSSAHVFQDNNGNWIGSTQAQTELLNTLGFKRV